MTYAQLVEGLPVLVAFLMGAMFVAVVVYGRQSTSAYQRGVLEGRRREREWQFIVRSNRSGESEGNDHG